MKIFEKSKASQVRKYNHGIAGVSGNLNYHFNHILIIPSRWDLYAGINVGFLYGAHLQSTMAITIRVKD